MTSDGLSNSFTQKGEKFEINYDKFYEKLLKTLIIIFPEKSPEYLKAFVNEVRQVDAGFISKDSVASYYEDFCEKCGVCCQKCPELQSDGLCRIWNQKYKSNNEWKPRKPEICDLWPYFEIPGEMHGCQPATGCPYSFKVILKECIKILRKNKK